MLNNKKLVLFCVIISVSLYADRHTSVIDITNMPSMKILEFDAEKKRASVKRLAEDAEEFFKKNTVRKACKNFSHSEKFRQGEVYVFVLDKNGVFLAHGQEPQLIWKNMYNVKDARGSYFVRDMLSMAKEGGGWVTYEWRDASKVSYVQPVKKDGNMYVIGAGYYPHSKKDSVITLVKGAVEVVKQDLKEGKPIAQAFSTISYPLGRFVLGDLYLYALDFEGNIFSNGNRPGLIGSNAWDYRDADGKLVNQEVVQMLETSAEGVWIDYQSKGALKRAYAEKVVDENDKEYFIACGYYPKADRKSAERLAKRAFQYMKGHGLSDAVKVFSGPHDNTYRFGDQYVVVYDKEGKCIAHGSNLDLIGQNHFTKKDEAGLYFVQEMIAEAESGGGWVDFKKKNSFESVYVEEIKLGSGEFIIGVGTYPVSKRETMLLIIKSGIGYLQSHDKAAAFSEFSTRDGKFIRGDLSLFVYDDEGTCFVAGDNVDAIWRNFLKAKDEEGRPIVQIFINTAAGGPDQVTFKRNNRQAVAYVEQVEKDGKKFVVGSHYYL